MMSFLVPGLLIAGIYCAQLLNWAAVGYLLARLRSPFPDGADNGSTTVVPDRARSESRMTQRKNLGLLFVVALGVVLFAGAFVTVSATDVAGQVKLILQIALALSVFMTAHCACCLSSLTVKLSEQFQDHKADNAILFYLKSERVRLLLWLGSWLGWAVAFGCTLGFCS